MGSQIVFYERESPLNNDRGWAKAKEAEALVGIHSGKNLV
jgi:hypothetical protein